VEWDITCYAEWLPKKSLQLGTKASHAKEVSLRQQYPLLNGVMASTPCIIVDMQGIILAWYLPGILTDSRQVSLVGQSNHSRKPDGIQSAMLVAQEKLCLLLKMLPSSSSWHDNLSNFHSGEDLNGLVTLLPGWFPQGHDMSTLAQNSFLSSSF
jgi:hypothetical protein